MVVQRKSVGVEFIPTSESFKKYGQQVQVGMTLSQEEIIPFLENIRDKKNTYGKLRCESTYNPELSIEQISDLKEIGFNTGDVLTVSFV